MFNKLHLHNIRCHVQTHMVHTIFAAVKPTQALTTLSHKTGLCKLLIIVSLYHLIILILTHLKLYVALTWVL